MRNFRCSNRPQIGGQIWSPATLKSGARGILQDCTGHVSLGLTCEISSVNSTIFRGAALCLRHSRAHIRRAADGKPTASYRARRTRPTNGRAGLARRARAPATGLPRPLEGASDPTPTREPHYSTAYMHMCFNGVKIAWPLRSALRSGPVPFGPALSAQFGLVRAKPSRRAGTGQAGL